MMQQNNIEEYRLPVSAQPMHTCIALVDANTKLVSCLTTHMK